jgi:hypothetical protein
VVVVENELVGYGLRNRENNNNNVLLIIFTLQRQNHSSLPKPSRVESSRMFLLRLLQLVSSLSFSIFSIFTFFLCEFYSQNT